MSRWRTLHDSLKSTFGNDVMSDLRRAVKRSPVITIGGDQLTGKSTLAVNVARTFGGELRSTGDALRQEATNRNISIGEMCKLAKNDLTIDLGVDMEVCRMICSGSDEGAGTGSLSSRVRHSPLVIQGRLPAALATMALEDLGKPRDAVHRIYLKCSIVEQALRFVSREIGPEEYEAARSVLQDRSFDSLADASRELMFLPLKEETKIALTKEFKANQSRDDDDRERFATLYGAEFDYRDSGMYDIEIDTSDIPPEETLRRALKSIRCGLSFPSY